MPDFLRVMGRLALLATAGGCGGPPAPPRSGDTALPPDTIDDPYAALGDPLEQVDVVVIGGGAAGLAAAMTALDAGASVLIVERAAILGGSGHYAAHFFGAGTPWQEDAGIEDSPEAALAEWEDLTGGDAEHPLVQGFVYGTVEILEWMTGYGAIFKDVVEDPGGGSVPRMHPLTPDEDISTRPFTTLAALLEPHAWLETTAADLVVVDGVVVGAQVSGAAGSGWIQAGAVVVATGGFARNLERVYAAVPQMKEVEFHAETTPWMDGNGLDLVERAGGALTNLENLGIYGHGVIDPAWGSPEVMVVERLADSVIVGPDASRVMDEDDTRQTWSGRHVLDYGPLFAIVDSNRWEQMNLLGMMYNYDPDVDEEESGMHMSAEAYADLVPVPSAGSVPELAGELGLDPDALEETIDDYNEAVEDGEDPLFGKDMDGLGDVSDGPFYALSIVAAPAKSFGGAQLDEHARVVSPAGDPIPGLYAAGEVAGMLGGAHAGSGFSGSITAVCYTGRLAGASAAAYAREP